MAIIPECNPAAEVQGPGPNSGDGNPIDVNVLTLPPVVIPGCVKVEDCPTGIPVRVNVQNASIPVTQATSPWVVSQTPGGVFVVTGNVTPTDVEPNPSNCVPVWSHGAVWDFNGGNWWKVRGGIGGGALGCPTVAWGTPSAQGEGGSAPYAYGTMVRDGNTGPMAMAPMLFRNQAGSSTQYDYQRTPIIFKTVQAVAAANTALWAPAVGRKFRLMRYMVEVTGNASIAGAGAVVTISLFDGAAGATGQAHDVFVPLVALAGIGLFTSGWIDLGNGYLSVLANNALNINLTAALVTGNVRVMCCGTEE